MGEAGFRLHFFLAEIQGDPVPAILTRLTRLTDTSLIVHWFTADHGLIKTAAKGALRPKRYRSPPA